MKLKTAKSVFGAVYLRLALVISITALGLIALTALFVVPELVRARGESISSVIRSQDGNILLSNIRTLRDELRTSGFIRRDSDFEYYFSGDTGANISEALKNCRFHSPNFCLGREQSVFFEPASSKPASEHYKYAVFLRGDLASPPTLVYLALGILVLSLATAFHFIKTAIRQKERYLLERLTVAMSAIPAERQTVPNGKTDEFDVLGETVEVLNRELSRAKATFERKTKLEQFGLLVGQVSHDLKAPLNEAENFLSSLPDLLEHVPREKLLEANSSLISRIRHGKEALNEALRSTQQASIPPERLELLEVVQSVSARAKASEKLKSVSISIEAKHRPAILGNRMRLQTALLNLVENSADEKDNAEVRIGMERDLDGTIIVTYQDNGPGISGENLDSIFEPLVTFKSQGTGLGLCSTKEIITHHGGTIRAVPSNMGARFEICLPSLEVANA